MISLTSAIRRRPGMSRSQFFHYLEHTHGAIARAEPGGVALYRQNHLVDVVAGTDGQSSYGVAPDRDNVTEVVFDSLPDLFADLARPYAREKIGPDGVNFSDLPSATALVGRMLDLDVPHPDPTLGAKVIAFLSAAPGLTLDEFTARWQAARNMVDAAAIAEIRQLSVQERLPEGDPVVGYFGGSDSPSYQGTVSLRLDDPATALVGAGKYFAALREADDGFLDLSRSWRALATELVIYERGVTESG